MNEPEPLEIVGRNWVRRRGRKLLYFSGCDYFRLARHPRVCAAARTALADHGLSVAASRLTTGNHPLYTKLENQLARFFGCDEALLTGTGYLTNLVVAQTLAGHFSHVLIDERAHPSLQDAAVFLGCPILRFAHCDADGARQAVERCGRHGRMILLTDGMFAHDGAAAPLRKYVRVLPRDAMVLVDDAHGAGVLGTSGKGTLEDTGVNRERVIQTITLSKAFGAYGGAILGSKKLKQEIMQRSALFAGHTPPPLPLAAAAMESIRILQTKRDFRRRLQLNAAWLKKRLHELGVVSQTPPAPGPIVCIAVDWKKVARPGRLERAFLEAGILPPITRYPGLPAQGYLRIVVSSEHTRRDLDRVARVCGNLFKFRNHRQTISKNRGAEDEQA